MVSFSKFYVYIYGKSNIMKIVVFSFLRVPGMTGYQIHHDDGDGWKVYEVEVEGTLFYAVTHSPVGFINSYIAPRDGKVIQVVEEDGYNHVRMYLEISTDTGQVGA